MNNYLHISHQYCKKILEGLGLVARIPDGGNSYRVIFADDYQLFYFRAMEMPSLELVPILNDNYEAHCTPVKEFHFK